MASHIVTSERLLLLRHEFQENAKIKKYNVRKSQITLTPSRVRCFRNRILLPNQNPRILSDRNLTFSSEIYNCVNSQVISNMTEKCTDCLEVFSNKGNLNRHIDKKVCYRSVFTVPIRDHISTSNEIISEIGSTRLKFHASHRLGVLAPKLYPLLFCKEVTTDVHENIMDHPRRECK